MRKPFNPPTVKHDIQFIKTMEPNAQGEMVEKRIVRISGPPLPGIETPYIDPSVPDVLKRYSLTDLLNQPVKPVEKLWGNYWQTGQLCILAGDMGTGKSTLAIGLAKSLSLTPGPSPKEGINIQYRTRQWSYVFKCWCWLLCQVFIQVYQLRRLTGNLFLLLIVVLLFVFLLRLWRVY